MRARSLLLCAALLATPPGALLAQAHAPGPARNRSLIALIDEFVRNPLAVEIGSAVMDSGDARHDVTMVLSKGVMPWQCYLDTAQVVQALDELLSMVYVAGNMRAQLVDGRNRNRPRAGLAAVVQGYAVIRERFPFYGVPEVDVWAALPRPQLAALADSLAAAPDTCTATQRRERYLVPR